MRFFYPIGLIAFSVATAIWAMPPSATEDEVLRFYSRIGASMHDDGRLTASVRRFLIGESTRITRFVLKNRYHHVIEVGSGYGRFQRSLRDRAGEDTLGLPCVYYLGVEIVPWLSKLGLLRSEQVLKNSQGRRFYSHVTELSAYEVSRLYAGLSTFSFLPFNLFGNLDATRIMATLRSAGRDVAISVYKTVSVATDLRKAYYSALGYRDVRVEKVWDEGKWASVLITSEDGLHSHAYTADYLLELFRNSGFELIEEEDNGEMGTIFYFSLKGERKPDAVTARLPSESPSCLIPPSLNEVCPQLFTLAEPPKSEEDTGLMRFESHPGARVMKISRGHMTVRTRGVCQPKDLFVVHFTSRDSSTIYMSVTGKVERVEPANEHGERNVVVRLRLVTPQEKLQLENWGKAL